MVVENNLNMQHYRENGAGSACSRTSILTLKSAHAPRVGQTDSRRARSSISSRARQIKDHEGDPFLSIDVLPKTNSQSNCIKGSGTTRYSAKASEYSRLTTSSSRPASNYSYGRDDELPGVFLRYISSTRPASLISLARLPQPRNVYIRMPFKQAGDVAGIEMTRMMSASPGQALTDSTTLAVHIANEILNKQKHQEVTHIQGRLLKARLKSLDPVLVAGPTIRQCRGITAETRTSLVCNRRTYHRLMAVLSKAHALKDMEQGMKAPLPVHQTSETSSLDSGIDAAFNENHDLGHEKC